ncbi:MAG TPA: hypothetical protein ENJ95_24615 [Bacteroidetes bacterium]|nr:hypothetical protein [Bacteroidota bacterium]
MKENFISGIHSYCDRWCERCRFVDRCAVGSDEKIATTELQMALADSPEEEMKYALQHVADRFVEIGKMLQQMIKDQGLDYDEIIEEAKDYEPPKPTQVQKHLEKRAMKYIKILDAFFEKHKTYFVPEKVVQQLLLLPGDPDENAEQIKNALDTIRWFQFFIAVKINRAWNSKQDDLFDDEDPIQNDFNGSAKVALIGIRESMDSWEVLRNAFTELDDPILDVLAFLDGIKKGMEGEFPDAWKFVRPGFDEGM